MLNIKSADAYRLARELADATGTSLTRAVTDALRERLAAVRRRQDAAELRASIADLQSFVASLPVRDARAAEQILGYDEHGLPS